MGIVPPQATGCSSNLLACGHNGVWAEIKTPKAAKLVLLSFALPVMIFVPLQPRREGSPVSPLSALVCRHLFRRLCNAQATKTCEIRKPSNKEERRDNKEPTGERIRIVSWKMRLPEAQTAALCAWSPSVLMSVA